MCELGQASDSLGSRFLSQEIQPWHSSQITVFPRLVYELSITTSIDASGDKPFHMAGMEDMVKGALSGSVPIFPSHMIPQSHGNGIFT